VASTRKELAESKQEFLSWKDQSLEKQHMLEKKIKEYFDLNAELTQNVSIRVRVTLTKGGGGVFVSGHCCLPLLSATESNRQRIHSCSKNPPN
jgi:hypothetical protein